MSGECVAESIPAGYKQTEVGVIPEDWEVKLFGDLFNISGGLSASRDQLSTEGYCYLHYGDIHTSKKTCIYVQSEQQDIPKLYIPLNKVPTNSLLEDGDIVFVDASEDDEGTSKHIVVFNKDKIPFISGLHTIVAKSKKNELHHHYRRYCFQTTNVKQQFRFFAVGTKVSGISKKNIAKIKLPIPSLPEQETIAQALTDADAFIESLEQLIAKKLQIKQGAMQELLTGKRRLSGFSSEWKTKTLQSIVQTPVTDGPHLTPHFLKDGIPFLSVNNLVNNKIDLTDLRFISTEDHEIFSRKCKPQKGDILLGKAASVGKVAIVDMDLEFNIWSPIAIVRVSNDNSARFLYYQLQSTDLIQQITLLTNSSSQGNIGMGDIEKLTLKLPPLTEQRAIATILSDMDAEITALEKKLEKSRSIKQGMMQELLTGRIRLV